MLRAIIVEDEQASRETLAGYLKKYCPDVQLMAMVDSVASGLEAIANYKPDIVFLDVEMPKGNAFDLLEGVSEITFETVFVTAFSQYAVKALNYSAAYYILKPVDIDELIAAVEKITNQRKKNQSSVHTQVLLENLRNANRKQHKIVLPLMDGFEVVAVDDIIRCEANDNFTNFYFHSRNKMMICRTLKFYEELLAESGFVRIHKSHLVNLEHVKKYHKGKGGQLLMSDGATVEVSPAKKEELLGKFEGK